MENGEYEKSLYRARQLLKKVEKGGTVAALVHTAEIMELAPSVLDEAIDRYEAGKRLRARIAENG